MKILVLSDNDFLLNKFKEIVLNKNLNIIYKIDFAHSEKNQVLKNKYLYETWIKSINIKKELNNIMEKYDLIFSLHSKQFFPKELVKNIRCINVHPGLNPYNRGWFPQVFSIINGLPSGVTIHEMDEFLDHGPIIYQEPVEITPCDTSGTVYKRILKKEIELLNKTILNIINNDYKKFMPEKGNLNLKKDFDNLCKLKLDKMDTLKNHINLLRALTHGEYKNAYFLDEKGNKIYITINLEKNE